MPARPAGVRSESDEVLMAELVDDLVRGLRGIRVGRGLENLAPGPSRQVAERRVAQRLARRARAGLADVVLIQRREDDDDVDGDVDLARHPRDFADAEAAAVLAAV